MMISMLKKFVDCHFHVFNAWDGLAGSRYRPDYDATMADWRAASAAPGILRGVLVQTSFMGTDNQRLLCELAKDPDNLRGVVVVAADDDTTQFPAWHAAGVRGIRLNLAGTSHDLREWSLADSIWQSMHALGWHLEIHTDVGRLPEVLTQLPADIPVVLDHMAKPEAAKPNDPTFLAASRRASTSAVHIKLSGGYRLEGRSPQHISDLWRARLGSESLLWGSDWPCTRHEQEADYSNLFKQLESWVGADLMDQVLIDNPEQLYWQARAQP